MLPDEVVGLNEPQPPPAEFVQLTVQDTPCPLVSFDTLPMIVSEAPAVIGLTACVIVTAIGAAMVTVAETDCVGAAADVAVIVTVPPV